MATAFAAAGLPATAQEPPAGATPARGPVVVEPTRPPDCLSCLPAPSRPSVITNPSWSRSPAPEYPAAAIAARVTEGQATVKCIVTTAGVLTECAVRETPAGYGFGEAALASTARARISPRIVDGAAENGRVIFTIRFRMPVEESPPVPVQ